MTIKYRIFPMRFNTALWRQTMRMFSDEMLPIAANSIGVSINTIHTWRNLKEGSQFDYPSMTNFINACNAFDINPQDFFVLDDGGRDE